MKLYPNVSYIFIIWFISVLLIAFFSFSSIPNSGKFTDNFFESLANWDGGHYLGIAEAGYSEKYQYAFFPLYPLAIRALNSVTENSLLSVILIGVSATFLGLHLLFRLIAYDFDKKIAEKTLIFFLLFPTSFFLLTAYTEGLFFFLSVSAFYFLRQNKLSISISAAALASATRLVGLAVVAAILIEIISKQGFNRRNWYIIFAPLGFIIYCIFLYTQTGDPFYFITAENHWQRSLAVPGIGFWEALKNAAAGKFIISNYNILLDLIFAIFGIGFAIRSVRFLPPSLSIYSLLSVAFPLFTPTLLSIPRFLLPIFPIFILMAFIKNRYVLFLFQILSTGLLAIFTALFISGYWVS